MSPNEFKSVNNFLPLTSLASIFTAVYTVEYFHCCRVAALLPARLSDYLNRIHHGEIWTLLHLLPGQNALRRHRGCDALNKWRGSLIALSQNVLSVWKHILQVRTGTLHIEVRISAILLFHKDSAWPFFSASLSSNIKSSSHQQCYLSVFWNKVLNNVARTAISIQIP